MNIRFCVVGLLVAGCLVGCPHNRYGIEMKPSGPDMERTLSVSRVGDEVSPANIQSAETKPVTSKSENLVSVPNEELTHISKVYPKNTVNLDGKVHNFTGKFTGKTPDDIGGAGSYKRFVTRMGSAYIYVERFRGDTDTAHTIIERLRAVDELTDLLIGWFQSEMDTDERFGKLRNFMDKELRRDLKNASMYLWLHNLRPREKTADHYETLMHIGLYFAERKYICLEDLPAISRALTTKADDDDPAKSLMPLIQRFVASKMEIGAKEPMPDSLKFLSDAKTIEKSLAAYLSTTKVFKENMQEWKKRIKTEPDASEPEPLEILQNLAEKAFHFELDLFGGDDELGVKLALPVKPSLTNGDWDEESKKVVWSGTLEGRAETYHRLPTLCYAVWAVPDKKFQQKHFGKIVLADQPLLNYCLWRNGLTDKEAREWDGFVDKCSPGEPLVDRLKKFRFSNDPAPAETDTQPDSTGRAGSILEEIIEALQNKN